MSNLRHEFIVSPGHSIQIRLGDLTQEDSDAIVNAANSNLAHGGGVARAIVQRGGAVIQEESERWVQQHGQVPTGQTAVTGPGALACKVIIHAVGPEWRGGRAGEEELLAQAVHNSLTRASELSLQSIALPAISSGIFGFPKDQCAKIMLQCALDYYREHAATSLHEIRFTNIDTLTTDIFVAALKEIEDK